MEYKLEETIGCVKKYSFAFGWDECQGDYEKAVLEVAKEAELPGFRKGKAPLELIKSKFKNPIETEVMDALLRKAVEEIIEKEGIIFIGNPYAEAPNFTIGEGLNGIILFELYPELPEITGEGLEIKVLKREVTDEQIKMITEELRNKHAKMVVFNDDKVKEGDFCSLTLTLEGTETTKNKFVACSKESENPLEKFIFDKDCNIEYELELTDSYQDVERGKYKVKIANVVRRILPEMNDDFAKLCGFENIDALRESNQKMAENENQLLTKEERDARIIEKLVDKYDFPLPPSLVKNQLEREYEKFIQTFERQGLEKDLDKVDWEEFGRKSEALINKRLKAFFIVLKLIEQQKIDLSEDELDEFLRNIAQRENLKVEKVREILKKNGQMEEIKFRLKEEKALENFAKNVKIEYVDKVPVEKGGENAYSDSR